MSRGKLIVIEGTDGSGKSTQFDLLIEWLKQKKIDFRQLRFPRYDNPSSTLVRMYLNGEFGTDPSTISPYAASTFYAVDRYAAFIQDFKEYYESGGLLVADRYTTSNAVHQGGKVSRSDQENFFKWLYDLEFNKMGLPKPDLVILMDMPIRFSKKLLQDRVDHGGRAKDIHELDLDYLASCRETSLIAAEVYKWSVVHGNDKDMIRDPQNIFSEIKDLVTAVI